VLAFAEYVRALVVDYAERYEDRADPWADRGAHRRETLDENKWRAARWGREASFVDRDCTGTVGLADAVEAECDRLGVDGIREVLDAESGAVAQRRRRETGGLDALCASLAL
jgi:carboxylate-amine ligase